MIIWKSFWFSLLEHKVVFKFHTADVVLLWFESDVIGRPHVPHEFYYRIQDSSHSISRTEAHTRSAVCTSSFWTCFGLRYTVLNLTALRIWGSDETQGKHSFHHRTGRRPPNPQPHKPVRSVWFLVISKNALNYCVCRGMSKASMKFSKIEWPLGIENC